MEATVHFFGLWASSYKGWHIIKARIVLFSISQGCLFHYHMFLLLYRAFLSFFLLFFFIFQSSDTVLQSITMFISHKIWSWKDQREFLVLFVTFTQALLVIFCPGCWWLSRFLLVFFSFPVARNHQILMDLNTWFPFRASSVECEDLRPARSAIWIYDPKWGLRVQSS